LHSPFLFDLFNEVIKPAHRFRLENVEALRKSLKSNHEVIDLFDLKSQKNYRKTISSIAKTSLSEPTFSALLFKLIEWLGVKRIMETGTSLGVNALYMAGPETVQKLTTVEASPIIAQIAQRQFATLFQNKIEIRQGTIQNVFESTIIKEQPELCFIDADHRSEAVAMCLEQIIQHTPTIQCIIIHDIYWSPDMQLQWKKIITDRRFRLTIDLFQAGLIFPNQEMPKQHFVLRF